MRRILDNLRLAPTDTVRLNVVFLYVFGERRAYTEGEHHTWLSLTGFAEIERIPLPEGVSIMTARKPV